MASEGIKRRLGIVTKKSKFCWDGEACPTENREEKFGDFPMKIKTVACFQDASISAPAQKGPIKATC